MSICFVHRLSSISFISDSLGAVFVSSHDHSSPSCRSLISKSEMGVTLGKKREPTENFRKIAKGVIQINKVNQNSPANVKKFQSTNQGTATGMRNSLLTNQHQDINSGQSVRRTSAQISPRSTSNATGMNSDNTNEYKSELNSSRALIFKDTSSAWEALKRGEAMESELPNTELVVVDSALGGFQTVERSNVSLRDDDTYRNGVISRQDATEKQEEDETEKEFEVPYELPIDWETRVRHCSFSLYSSSPFSNHAVPFKWWCSLVPSNYAKRPLLNITMGHLLQPNDTAMDSDMNATPHKLKWILLRQRQMCSHNNNRKLEEEIFSPSRP